MNYHATYEERPFVCGAYTYSINGVGLGEIVFTEDDYEHYSDDALGYSFDGYYDTEDPAEAVFFILDNLNKVDELEFTSLDDLSDYGKRQFIEVAKVCGVWADIYERDILSKVDTSHIGISDEVMQEW